MGGGPHGCSTVSRAEVGREAQKEKQRQRGARKQRTKSAAKKQVKRAVAEVQLQADHMGTGRHMGAAPFPEQSSRRQGSGRSRGNEDRGRRG